MSQWMIPIASLLFRTESLTPLLLPHPTSNALARPTAQELLQKPDHPPRPSSLSTPCSEPRFSHTDIAVAIEPDLPRVTMTLLLSACTVNEGQPPTDFPPRSRKKPSPAQMSSRPSMRHDSRPPSPHQNVPVQLYHPACPLCSSLPGLPTLA